jgi:hypothetical protein
VRIVQRALPIRWRINPEMHQGGCLMAPSTSEPSRYVWIRLVKSNVEAKVAVGKLEVVPTGIGLAFGGPRPPSARSGVKSAAGGASATFLLDPWHSGLESADTCFDLGPAFEDLDDARQWIVGAAGKAWAADACNYFLLGLTGKTPAIEIERTADLQPTPNPGKDHFPPTDWDPVLRATITRPGGVSQSILGEVIPLDHASTFGGTGSAVLEELVAKKAQRTPHGPEIDFEAQGLDQVTFLMLKVVGLSTDHPVNQLLKNLRDAVLDSALAVLWYYKLQDPQQPRPRQLHPSIEPRFERPHWRNPGHPSFPAGHATIAHTWAALLSNVFSSDTQKIALAREAGRIASNREIAGLHFPRDTAAGKVLGQRIAEAIIRAVELEKGPPGVEAFKEGMDELRRLRGLITP